MLFALILSSMGQATLSGSHLTVKEAQAKARIVVVARHELAGPLLGAGVHIFGTVKLRPSESLKGKTDGEKVDSVSITCSGKEEFPKKGEAFIFFLDDCDKHLNVVKVIPATAEDLESVRRQQFE